MAALKFQGFATFGLFGTLVVITTLMCVTETESKSTLKDGVHNQGSVEQTMEMSWLQIGLVAMASICVVVAMIGCIDMCRKTGFQDFQNEEPSMITPPAADHFSMFPPVESTPEPAVSSAAVYFEPLPDIRPKTLQSFSNAELLRPKISQILESNARPSPSGGDDTVSDKLKLQNFVQSNTRYTIQRSCLQYIKELGGGWFGKALQGEGSKIQPGHKKTKVVVKMLKDEATLQEQLMFFEEAAPYRDIENPHVLKLLGQCTETSPLLVVLEQCPFGDLKTYLHNHRVAVESFSEKGLLLKFACDMAAGLQCLHQHQFVHRDFSARNCLLGPDLGVKVGDYGISEEIHKEDYYFDKHGEAIPIRWLPPESIEYNHSGKVTLRPLTKEANIWSFGISIWEVAQFGSLPFSDLKDDQVLRLVHREKCLKPSRPDTPIHHMDRLYQLMQFCWGEPSARPSLRELRIMLLHLLSRKTETDTSAFDQKWNQLLPKKTPQKNGEAKANSLGNGTVRSQDSDFISQSSQDANQSSKLPSQKEATKQAEIVLSIQDEFKKSSSSASVAPPVGSPVNELSLEQELAGFTLPPNEYIMDEDLVPPTPPSGDLLDASFDIDVATPSRSRASTAPDSLILEIERISNEIALEELNDGSAELEVLMDPTDGTSGAALPHQSLTNFTTSTPKRSEDADDVENPDKSVESSKNSDYHTATSQQLDIDFPEDLDDDEKHLTIGQIKKDEDDNYATRKFSDYLATVATSIDISDEADLTMMDLSKPDLSLLSDAINETSEAVQNPIYGNDNVHAASLSDGTSSIYQSAGENTLSPSAATQAGSDLNVTEVIQPTQQENQETDTTPKTGGNKVGKKRQLDSVTVKITDEMAALQPSLVADSVLNEPTTPSVTT